MENWLVCFLPKFLTLKISLLLRKAAKNSQMSEAREKSKNNNVAWDVANNRYVNHFFSKKAKKNENKIKTEEKKH